jgi:hypothetical protein
LSANGEAMPDLAESTLSEALRQLLDRDAIRQHLDHFDIAGTYHWRLVRLDAGWRIQSLRLDIAYTNGSDTTGLAG